MTTGHHILGAGPVDARGRTGLPSPLDRRVNQVHHGFVLPRCCLSGTPNGSGHDCRSLTDRRSEGAQPCGQSGVSWAVGPRITHRGSQQVCAVVAVTQREPGMRRWASTSPRPVPDTSPTTTPSTSERAGGTGSTYGVSVTRPETDTWWMGRSVRGDRPSRRRCWVLQIHGRPTTGPWR